MGSRTPFPRPCPPDSPALGQRTPRTARRSLRPPRSSRSSRPRSAPSAGGPVTPSAGTAAPTPAAGTGKDRLALAQATPAGVSAAPAAQAPITLPPCAGGLVVLGLAAGLPLWSRRGARRL